MDHLDEIKRAIVALEAQRAVVGDSVVDTALVPLRAKLERLQAESLPGPFPAGIERQRKQVTVLFARITGLAEMADGVGAEELNSLLNALWLRLDALVVGCGGIVDKHVGPRLMAIFGAPLAHEDDPRQALRAALQMKEAVDAFNEENGQLVRPALRVGADRIRFQAGLNTGRVVLGAVGSTGEYTAMGDTVNVASRVEEAARPGLILVSHATYRHVRGLFDALATDPIFAKGKSEPVPTYQITVEKSRAFPVAPRPVAGAETPTVGREKELARMQSALRAVFDDGTARALIVVGDAGVGKTRLLYEFQNWLELLPERVWLFQAQADPQATDQPYALLRSLLSFRFEIRESDPAPLARQKLEDGICEFIGEDGVEQAHFIGHLIGLDFSHSPYLRNILDDARQIQGRALHYLAQFMQAMARVKPVLFFIESVQWADLGSLELLQELLLDCAESPLLVFALARPAFLARWRARIEGEIPWERLHLQPLSPTASTRLLREILRPMPVIPQRLETVILSKAAGNPFYIEEMVKMLIDDRVIVTGEETWKAHLERLVEDRIPATLTGVLQARLDGLTALERDVLQRAAVIGPVFWDDAVSSLHQVPLDESALREALATLVAREMVFRQQDSAFSGSVEYSFKHAILHTVAYESVLLQRRRAYHAAAARWLVDQGGERVAEYAGLIAEHYERARAIEAAGQWYARAGRRAQEAYLPQTAITYYRKALAYLPEAGDLRLERIHLYEGLGDMLWRQAQRAESTEMYEAMQQLAASSGNSLAEVQAWNLLARAHRYLGQSREGLDCARRAELLARAGGAPQADLARALAMQGWCHHGLGQPERAIALAEQGLALAQAAEARREEALNLNLLGVAHAALGRYEEGAAYGQRALAVYRAMGNRWGMGIISNNLGENARARGDYAAALRFYEEALAIARETGNRESQISCYNNIGGARLGLGEYKLAEEALQEVLARVGDRGWFALSETYRFLAEAYLGQKRPESALPAAARALAIALDREQPDATGSAWRVLGQVAATLGTPIQVEAAGEDPLTAATCFAHSERAFATAGMAAERARALQAWARYEHARGNRKDAGRLMSEAQSIFARLGIPLEVAKMN